MKLATLILGLISLVGMALWLSGILSGMCLISTILVGVICLFVAWLVMGGKERLSKLKAACVKGNGGLGLTLLVVVSVMANWLVLSHCDDRSDENLAFTALFCTASLLAIWIVMGGKYGVWRFVSVIILVTISPFYVRDVLLVHYTHSFWSGWEILLNPIYLVILLIFLMVQMVPLLIARLLGVRVRWMSRNLPIDQKHRAGNELPLSGAINEPKAKRFQWSIGSMLTWITAAAIMLSCFSIWQIGFPGWLIDEGLWFWAEIALIATMCCTMPLVVLWAVLGRTREPIRIILLVLDAICRLLLLNLSEFATGFEVLNTFVLWVPMGLIGALFIIRWSGYHLLWRGRVV